jgi:hypothetical protein
MSTTRRTFEDLVRQAQGEPLPPLDVVARVLHTIRVQEPLRRTDWPLWIAAAVSVVAAAALLLLTQQPTLWNDPFAQWLYYLNPVIQ